MNTAVLFALACASMNTINDLVYRKSSIENKGDRLVGFYFFSAVFSALLSLILNLIQFGSIEIDMKNVFYGVVAGFISFAGYLLFLSSFGRGDISVNVTIYRLNLVPTVLLGIVFIGETLDFTRIVAILLCIGSIFMFSGLFERKTGGGAPDYRSIILSLSACLVMSVLNFWNKLAMMNGAIPFRMMLWRFIIVSIVAFTIVIKKTHQVSFNPAAVRLSAISGPIMIAGIFFYLSAVSTGDLNLVAPISQLSFVLIGVISFVFLKEEFSWRKIAGLVLAVVAVILI